MIVVGKGTKRRNLGSMLKERVVQVLTNHVSWEREKVASLGVWTGHLHVGGWQRFWKDMASSERGGMQVPTCQSWGLWGLSLGMLSGQLYKLDHGNCPGWKWLLPSPGYGCQLKHRLVRSPEGCWWRKRKGGACLPRVLQGLESEKLRGEQQSHWYSRHCRGRARGMSCPGGLYHRLQLMAQEWPQDLVESGHLSKSSWLPGTDGLICSSCLLRSLEVNQHTCPIIKSMSMNRCHTQPLWHLLNKAVCFAPSYLNRERLSL